MARVKGGNIHKNRRKKVLKLAKGYFGSKHKLYKTAKEQVMHSLKYALTHFTETRISMSDTFGWYEKVGPRLANLEPFLS